jgi:hypothetical protein
MEVNPKVSLVRRIVVRILPFLVMLILGTAVLGGEVITDYDRQTDMSNFKTFAWLELEKYPIFRGGIPEERRKMSDEDLDKMIRSYVDIELTKKGFLKATDSEPDFLVSYYAVAKLQMEVQEYDSGSTAHPNLPYGHWRPFYESSSDTLLMSQGTLSLDIIDAEEDHLIWRASATDIFEQKDSNKKAQKKLRKIIKKILKKFPPK